MQINVQLGLVNAIHVDRDLRGQKIQGLIIKSGRDRPSKKILFIVSRF